MKYAILCAIMCGMPSIAYSRQKEHWITILVHGAFGFQANASLATAIQAKRDMIEGTAYERNVLRMREHPFFSMVQPIQKMGLRRVKAIKNQLNAAYAYAELFKHVQLLSGIQENNEFYTFGWSGLISQKRRRHEACILYKQLKRLTASYAKKGITPKIRLIGYSHGANFVLNLSDICRDESQSEKFSIDELILIGMPVHAHSCRQIQDPIYKRIYSLYSNSDRVQTIDISTGTHLISHRTFKGCVPANLTQIEMRVTGPLTRSPYFCLPPHMRGVVNQSPGHIEFWFFGWTPSSYRKNISLYPLPASVLLPYLMSTAKNFGSNHVQITIRPDKEFAYIRSVCDDEYYSEPFFTRLEFAGLITKALTFHPSRPEYKDTFVALQTSSEIKAYL